MTDGPHASGKPPDALNVKTGISRERGHHGAVMSSWSSIELGVHRSVGGDGDPNTLPFVERASSALLERLVVGLDAPRARPLMVVLVGDTCVGKTRTLHHVVSKHLANWSVAAPADSTHLRLLFESGIPPNTIVWLDDLAVYLEPIEHGPANAGHMLDLLLNPRTPPTLLAGAIWPSELIRITQRQSADAKVVLRLFESYARTIVVPDVLNDDALPESMRTAISQDARIRHAVETSPSGRVTQTLAGGPLLVARYEGVDTARALAFTPGAKALLDSAVELRRIGFPNPIPAVTLGGAAPGFLDEERYGSVQSDWIDDALREVCGEHLGIAALTPRASAPALPDSYHLHDYLFQHCLERKRFSATRASTWAVTIRRRPEELQPEVLFRLAANASARGLYSSAAELLRQLMSLGHSAAYSALLEVLAASRSPKAIGELQRYAEANGRPPWEPSWRMARGALWGSLAMEGDRDAAAMLHRWAYPTTYGQSSYVVDHFSMSAFLKYLAYQVGGPSHEELRQIAHAPQHTLDEIVGYFCAEGNPEAIRAIASRQTFQGEWDASSQEWSPEAEKMALEELEYDFDHRYDELLAIACRGEESFEELHAAGCKGSVLAQSRVAHMLAHKGTKRSTDELIQLVHGGWAHAAAQLIECHRRRGETVWELRPDGKPSSGAE